MGANTVRPGNTGHVLLVILVLATAAILVGVVLVALGRAGEMATFPGDGPPLEPDGLTAADVALYRPSMAFWGYYVPAVEEAFQLIARTVTAKDAEIAALREEVDELRNGETARESWGTPRRSWAAEPGPAAAGLDRSWAQPGETPAEPGKPWAEGDNIWAESDKTWGMARQEWDEPGDGGTVEARTIETPIIETPVSEPAVGDPPGPGTDA